MKTIGDRIKLKRKELNLTQLELAEKLNVTDRAVSKWEQNEGNPDLNIIPALCDVLGVTTDYLLLGKEEDDRISLDDMDETKRFELLLKKDNLDAFIKYGYDKKYLFTKNNYYIDNGKNAHEVNERVWKQIFDVGCKKIIKHAFDTFMKLNRFLVEDYNANLCCLLRGDINRYIKAAVDFDMADFLNAVQLKFSGIKEKAQINRAIGGYDVINHINLYRTGNRFNYEKINCVDYYVEMATIEYIFENKKNAPICFDYITDFEFSRTNRNNNDKFYLKPAIEDVLVGLCIKYQAFDKVEKILSVYKAEADRFEKLSSDMGYRETFLFNRNYSETKYGRIISFKSQDISELAKAGQIELAKKICAYHRELISKLKPVFYGETNKINIFVYTDDEIDRIAALSSGKLSEKEKYEMRCVNNYIVDAGALRESSDLKFIKKTLESNYIHYYEFAYDAIVNGNRKKEFYKLLIDNDLTNLAKDMLVLRNDEAKQEFLRSAWTTFNTTSSSKLIFSRQHSLSNIDVKDGAGALKDNSLIAKIHQLKEEIYNSVVDRLEAEKKAQKDKEDRAKAVKGLTKSYFEKLLNDDGKELFMIKLCALLDAIFKFDFKLEGEDFSERMKAYFSKIEGELPQPRTCDDGWGYMVDDRDWFESTVKPAREKFEHLSNLLHRLRMQRNNISHAEAHDVEELSMAELKECLEYVFSINKVEE